MAVILWSIDHTKATKYFATAEAFVPLRNSYHWIRKNVFQKSEKVPLANEKEQTEHIGNQEDQDDTSEPEDAFTSEFPSADESLQEDDIPQEDIVSILEPNTFTLRSSRQV